MGGRGGFSVWRNIIYHHLFVSCRKGGQGSKDGMDVTGGGAERDPYDFGDDEENGEFFF